MRVQLGRVFLASAVAAGMLSGTAAAQSVDWATCGTAMPNCSSTVTGCCNESAANLNFGSGASGSPSADKAILIAMDRCHQPLSAPATMAPPGTAAPMWCQGSPAGTSNGMMFAYGLVYRLMQVGVPVYWAVNPTKHASAPMAIGNASDHTWFEDDIDMWILHSSQTNLNIPTGAGALTSCTGACTGPVSLLDDSLAIASTYQYKEFPLRGGAFLIAGGDTDGDSVSDRAEFNSFWQNYGDGSPASGTKCGIGNNDCYDFTQVAIWEVNTTAIPTWKNYITSAPFDGVPVAVKLNYKPPRIARTDSSGAVSDGFLLEANLRDTASSTCTQGVFVHSSGTWPYDPVVCDVTETEMLNGALVTGGFGWAWFDGSSFASCSKALQAIRTFITGVPGVYQAGNVMVNDSTIRDVEECANHQLLGRYGAKYAASTGSLELDNSAFNEQRDQPFTMSYPTNLFAQYGDLPLNFASSSVGYWKTGTTWGYNTKFAGSSTLKRLITREASSAQICGDIDGNGQVASAGSTIDPGDKPHYFDVFPHASAGACHTVADKDDGAAYGRFDNNPINGIVFYLPGNQFSNNGARAQLRMLLNSLIATPVGIVTPPTLTAYEVSRASPVVPLINGVEYIVQGTYVPHVDTDPVPVINGNTDIGGWYFPFRVGHMRARLASAPATVLLDAGCNSTLTGFACPAGASGPAGSLGIPGTRKIFTNTAGGDLRGTANVYLDALNLATGNTANEIAVRTLLNDGLNLSNATLSTMRDRIYAGYPNGSGGYISVLGGVDRSTVAVIQKSDVAIGGTARPMMAYFGAADGMMHAVCMETNAAFGCTDEGLELWAFMPRKQLPLVRTNTQRIDGSARVLDAYIDPDGAGTTYQKSWRTILVFQTGSGSYTGAVGREPAVYALDITVPNSPMMLWEYTDPAVSTFSLGHGLTTSAGSVMIAGTTKYLVWVDTNNLSLTGGPGTVVTAINLETGVKHRQVPFTYSPNPRVVANDRVVATGIPGGTVPLDLPSGNSGKVTHIMVNDIYGRMWLLNPDTLVSVNGATTPMFTQTADYYAMGPKPAVYSQGGSQYAVFTTGFYHDPTNTTWPLACCKSDAAGTACLTAALQPDPAQTCSQYNNSTFQFPLQMAVAVKVDTTSGTSYSVPAADCDSDPSVTLPACASTGFLFRKSLGRDERGTSQALVVGTDIFLSTESDNVNRTGYGTTGGSTGHLYQLAGATGTFAGASTAVVLGAGAPAASNSGGGVYAGVGTFTSGSTGTTGSNVASQPPTGVKRKVWLRTE